MSKARTSPDTARAATTPLAALFQQAPVAIAVFRGPDHVYELANPAYLRMVQRDASIVGKPLREAFPEVAGQDVLELFDAVYRSGRGRVRSESPVTLAEGRTIYFAFNLEPLRDEAGTITGLVAISQDITEQVLARQRVERLTAQRHGLEGRLRMALAAAELGTWDRDLRTDELTWDDTTKRTLGMSPDEETPESVLPKVHPADIARVQAAVERAHDPEGDGDYEVEFRVLGGHEGEPERWCLARGKVFFEDGRPIRFLGVSQDITRRKQAEAEHEKLLREEFSQQLLTATSKGLSQALDPPAMLDFVANLAVPAFADWVFIDMLDASGVARRAAIAHADPALAPLATSLRAMPVGAGVAGLGETESALLQFGDDGALPPDVDPALARVPVRSALVVPLVARAVRIGVMTLAYAASGRRYAETDRPLAEQLGRHAALALENARLYAEAERERRRAEEANRAKDEFLAMLGHELRNPLAPILSALDVLRRRGEHNTREHGVIERHAQHLVRLVDDLLDVARVMRGAVTLHRQRVPLKHVVARALELTGPLIEQRRQSLRVEVPPMGLDVDVDPLRMVQVVANLLTNAAKYTELDGSIHVSAREDGAAVVLTVHDTGIGIAPEILARIFDPFVQEQQSLDRAQGGLGIGLALVHSFVTLHGGTVTAESAGRGRGSTFTVRLPRAEPGVVEAPRAAAAPPAVELSAPRRVLVVDDNEDAGAMLAEALRLCGYQVWIAHDGAEALRVAADVEPTVALLDIGLPHMDGYELATHLRALPLSKPPRLLAITGYGREADRMRAFAVGFEGHFVKPVNLDAVMDAVEKLLRTT